MKDHLHDRPLVFVSNREPYIHSRSHGKVAVERGSGGLIAVLDAAIQATGGLWVAWGSGDADWEVTDQEGRVAVPPDQASYLLKRIRLSEEEVEYYYHGFSNRFCWPLFHGILHRVKFNEKEWQAYQEVNFRFAHAIVSEVAGKPSPVIWIQDYHLACLPRMIRECRPDAILSLFWHIPWPARDIFNNVPCGKEILKSLLSCDMIGFQTDHDRDHFSEAVGHELDACIDPSNQVITYRNQTTQTKTFAASIDTEGWIRSASRITIENEILHLRQRLGLAQKGFLGIGVDRIEYTKGLIERFEAIDLFLTKNPQFLGKFTFVQIASPTRGTMTEYQEYQKAVTERVQGINKKYPKWQPIVWHPHHVPAEDLVVYYRAADLAIVSSLADGMNLVAKEFVASQIDERGVLLLSQFAGASHDMHEALFIDPTDISGFAEQIKAALLMPAATKKTKLRAMREHLQINNVYKWVGTQLLESLRLSPSVG